MDPKTFLESLFKAVTDAAQPALQIPRALREISLPKGRIFVIGAGKASANMALAVERSLHRGLSGLVITRYGLGANCERIEIVEAAHPIPDANGLAASRRILDRVANLGRDDLVLALISGGGSALLTVPAEGLSFKEKKDVNRQLLASGAGIREINCVRKHMSAVKGGRLALACHPAKVITLIISDVPGDDPADIASGPTIPDPSTSEEALSILSKYGIDAPTLLAHIAQGEWESPKPGDPSFDLDTVRLIASPRLALEAAAKRAEEVGIRAHILSDAVEGESRAVAAEQAAIVASGAFKAPCVLLSGGETTVKVVGGGKGGRNAEFAAAMALAISGQAGVFGLAADTDGVDGNAEIAGAFADGTTVVRTAGVGHTVEEALAKNDTHTLFSALGDSFVTGQTGTNVGDFRALLVL